jgi:hypothetical protein
MGDDTVTPRKPGVGTGAQDGPGHVLARPPTGLRGVEEEGLTPVDGVGPDLHDDLAGARRGVRDVVHDH